MKPAVATRRPVVPPLPSATAAAGEAAGLMLEMQIRSVDCGLWTVDSRAAASASLWLARRRYPYPYRVAI